MSLLLSSSPSFFFVACSFFLLLVGNNDVQAAHDDAASAWPPPIAPVWPVEFTAVVHGPGHDGVWYYSWPRNQYKAIYYNRVNDTDNTDVRLLEKETQFWNASEGKFYAFHEEVR